MTAENPESFRVLRHMQSVQGFQGAVSGNNIQGGKGHLNFKHQYLVVTEA